MHYPYHPVSLCPICRLNLISNTYPNLLPMECPFGSSSSNRRAGLNGVQGSVTAEQTCRPASLGVFVHAFCLEKLQRSWTVPRLTASQLQSFGIFCSNLRLVGAFIHVGIGGSCVQFTIFQRGPCLIALCIICAGIVHSVKNTENCKFEGSEKRLGLLEQSWLLLCRNQ